MSNEIKEKEEYEKYARDHRKELDAQEVRLGDIVTVLVGHFAGEKGVIVGMIACDKSDYADPYYEIEMECDVPEEFRVRKTLIGRSRVIGGVEKLYLKVIGNRAPKQQTDEIKVGDKVRVREDAPNLHPLGWDAVLKMNDSVVLEIEGDTVWVKLAIAFVVDNEFPIPLKYLIKVEEEKEPKFKVGDVVRLKDIYYKEELRGRIGTIRKIAGCHIYVEVDSTIYPAIVHSIEPCTEPTAPKFKVGDRVKFKNIYELQKVKDKSFRWMLVMFASKEATITAVEDNGFYRVDISPSIGGINDDMIECKVEPTEQTEAEKNDADNLKKVAEEWANEVSNAIEEYGDAMCKIYVEAHNEAYWDAYTADLAKEVALKVANKFNDPKEVAEYAVSVAKAVVEGLKSK